MTGPHSRVAITEITGGVGGLAASYAAMVALADRLAATADRLRDLASDDVRVLADPDLVESAPLSPVTFAEAEARVAEATSGPHGVLVLVAVYEGDALLVRATVTAYQDADRVVATSYTELDGWLGRAAGTAMRGWLPELLLAGVAAGPAWHRLPVDSRRRLAGEVEQWVDAHPAVVQHAVDGSGGLLDGLLGLPSIHPTAAGAAADLAQLYPPEGPPRVRRRPDLATPLGDVPPPDLEGLLRHLRQTNALSAPESPDDQGTIEVQTLRSRNGAVRHIVYLPGTDDPTEMPGTQDDDVRDLAADLRQAAGEHTAYATGIQRAMAEAGIGAHDPVLLVGHSLGGMEAASLLGSGTPYDVTHVVTAGSPIADVPDGPPGTHVLSLENRGDVVPLLDGRDNADSVSRVTVQFDDPGRSLLGSHALRHYVRGAAALDASCDPSIREQLASLRDHGFLGARGRVTSQVFQISR